MNAITRVISPEATSQVESARLNARQKRRRVQAQTGEILTEIGSAERLQEEQRIRQAMSDKGKGVKGKNLAKGKKGKPVPEATSGSANEKSGPPKQTQTPDKTNASAHQDEDSESEQEVIRPRKPRRKLIPPEATSGSANGNSGPPKQTPTPLEGISGPPDKTNESARQDEDSESEPEVVRPRKPRRKLIGISDDEPEATPKSNGGAVQKAFRKIFICESADLIQDFEGIAF